MNEDPADYLHILVVSCDKKVGGGGIVKYAIVRREETACDGKNGYLCAEWIGGASDVLDYLFTWMDGKDAEFMDPDVLAAYIGCFEAKGRPRDEELIETIQILNGFSPPDTAEQEMQKVIHACDDEFMRHIGDFVEYAREIVRNGKTPLVLRYSGDDDDTDEE